MDIIYPESQICHHFWYFATVYHLCITGVKDISFCRFLGFVSFCVTVNMSSPVDRSVIT